MTSLDIIHALSVLTPSAEWVLQGDDLSGLTWLDNVQARPTDDEIVAAIAAYVPPPDPMITLQNQITTLQSQIATLLAAQGK